MNTKASIKKATYRQHTPTFKDEVLQLATQVGVAKAAKELGLHESQLYN